jgi:hypothetical protein
VSAVSRRSQSGMVAAELALLASLLLMVALVVVAFGRIASRFFDTGPVSGKLLARSSPSALSHLLRMASMVDALTSASPRRSSGNAAAAPASAPPAGAPVKPAWPGPLFDSDPDSNGCHFVPALAGLRAPYWAAAPLAPSWACRPIEPYAAWQGAIAQAWSANAQGRETHWRGGSRPFRMGGEERGGGAVGCSTCHGGSESGAAAVAHPAPRSGRYVAR